MFRYGLMFLGLVALTGCEVGPLLDQGNSGTGVEASSKALYPTVSRIADGSWYMGTWFSSGPNGGRVVHQTYGFWTDIRVQNLAYNKKVGIVYTTNDWLTNQVVYAVYEKALDSGTEQWGVDLKSLEGAAVKYAVFSEMNGVTTWDNNNGANYTVILK